MSSAEFKINFISGKNLVLVERNGYDSEIFIPIITNERIQLVNVVNNRRCCASNTSILKVISNLKVEQSSNGNISPILPINISKESKKENSSYLRLQNNNNLKVTKIYTKKSTGNTPRKILTVPLPIIEDQLNKSFIETSSTLLNKNFGNVRYSAGTTSTPLFQRQKLNVYGNKNVKSLGPPNTVTKWRKCLTPIKTYSKNRPQGFLLNRSPAAIYKTGISQTPRMIPIEKTYLPDYIRNQTKGCDGDAILEIKKCKLIVDRKLIISPKSYKNQLKNTEDLKRDYMKLPETKFKILHSKFTSYDLLTTSNFRKCMAKKLKYFYTTKCLRKRQLTEKKYKKLIDSLPLLNDGTEINYGFLQPRKLII